DYYCQVFDADTMVF
nr:immunoglobulin light chain junction region [Macaca mulatta]